MLPIRDENPTLRTPVATYALIAANVAVWVFIQGMGSEPRLTESVCMLGLIPAEFLGRLLGLGIGTVGVDPVCPLQASWRKC